MGTKFSHAKLPTIFAHLLLVVLLSSLCGSATAQQVISLQLNAEVISNNSLVEIIDVGSTSATSLQCLTNRTDCCDSATTDTGDWLLPSGTGLGDSPVGVDFYRLRRPSAVDLLRNTAVTSPEGLFRCEIPVSSAPGETEVDTIYVGLYVAGNGIPLIINITVDTSSLSISCTSSGGPASSVAWTRDRAPISFPSADYTVSSIVTDTEQATYANILTASSSSLLEGNFTCTVSNLAGNDSQSISVTSAGAQMDAATGTEDSPTTQAPTTVTPPSGLHFQFGSAYFQDHSLFPFLLTDITENDPLLCVTDNPNCCSSDEASDPIGEWRFPNGSFVQRNNLNRGMYRTRRSMVVRLHRREGVVIDGGLFTCFDIVDSSGVERQLVIGIYPTEEEGVPEATQITENPGVSLTCTSLGGPVSQVTWIRDGQVISPSSPDYRFTRVVTDYSTSAYQMTLEGLNTGSLVGNFTCVVQNSRGRSNVSAEVVLSPPPVPDSLQVTPAPSSAVLSWNLAANTLLREYRLSYSYAGPCPEGVGEGMQVVLPADPGAITPTSHTLVGLSANSLYMVELVAVNDGGSSEVARLNFTTSAVAPTGTPQSPSVTVTMTTVTVTWDQVECPLRNSDIIGYRLTSMSAYDTSTVDVPSMTGGGAQSHTLSALIPNTLYEFSLQAVGEGGLAGPYVTFNATTDPVQELVFQWNGERYGNHSLLDPSGIGEGMEALFCLTPRLDCCKRGGNNGDWFDSEGQDVPIGTELGEDSGFYNNRGVSAVRLNRRGSLSSDFTSGIFLCEIPDVDDIPQYLYIGLYLPNTGAVTISSLTYDPESGSLVCTSTGGPPTSVQWWRDQAPLGTGPSQRAYQLVLDTSAATYSNVLELSAGDEERENLGSYECRVSNDRGNDSTQLTVMESVVSVPSSIQVGVPATLTCGSASGTGEEVQWLNATGHVLDSAPGVANLSLPLSPAQVMDNGTVLACRVSNHVTTLVLISVLESGPPLDLLATSEDSGYSFSWSPPADTLPSYFSYQLTCTPDLAPLGTLTRETEVGVASATMSDMEEGSSYECSVVAMAAGYVSRPVVIMVTTEEVVPDSAPPSFEIANITPREVTFRWEPLPLTDRNGDITSYTLQCNASSPDQQGAGPQGVYRQAGENVLGNFRPNSSYQCEVFASNGAGRGPSSVSGLFNTSDELALFQLELSTVTDCLAWRESDGAGKIADIEGEIVRSINQRCPSCMLLPDRLTSGQLVCFSESPTTVTYRAELHGTLQRTTTQLLAELRAWANSEALIQVRNAQMSLVVGCEVEIQSLGEEKCAIATAAPAIGLPLVVGVAVGGAVVVCLLCLVVVVCARVVLKRRRNKMRSRDLRRIPESFENPSNGLYEPIRPPLPPWPPREAQPDTKEDCTSFQNPRTASDASERYGPTPNVTGGVAAESQYSEIDGAQMRPRRASDYELVRVGNKMVTTEESHPLSPSRQGQYEVKGEDSGRVPSPYTLPSDDSELLRNPAFRSADHSPFHGGAVSGVSGSWSRDPKGEGQGVELIKNESYSEIPPGTGNKGGRGRSEDREGRHHARSRSLSKAKNPMYITFSSSDANKTRDDASTVKGDQSAEYAVIGPKSAAKKMGGSIGEQRGREVTPAITNGKPRSVETSSNSRRATYDVPPSKSRSREVVRDKLGVANSGFSSTYDVPTNNTLARAGGGDGRGSGGGASTILPNPFSSTYDVPTNNSLANRPQDGGSSAEVTERSPSPHPHPGWYDVPPSLGKRGGAGGAEPTHYDVPPLEHQL